MQPSAIKQSFTKTDEKSREMAFNKPENTCILIDKIRYATKSITKFTTKEKQLT